MPTAKLSDIEVASPVIPSAPVAPTVPVVPDKPDTENEPDDEPKQTHDWSSTQLNLPPELENVVRAFAATIPPESILDQEDEGEDTSHVTVLYGIDTADPEVVKAALEGQNPVVVKFGKMSLFESDDSDVLKIEVESPQLEALNKYLRGKLPHIETFFDYVPHATISYLKLGEGGEYDSKPLPGVTGKRAKLSVLTFSSKDGTLTDIPLGDPKQSSEAPVSTENQPQTEEPQSVNPNE